MPATATPSSKHHETLDGADLVDRNYLDTKLEQLRGDLYKWAFIYVITTVLTIATCVLMAIRLSQ